MHLNNKLIISKSKGILTTSPKIATGTCSWRLAVRGPARPTGPGHGAVPALALLAAGTDGTHSRSGHVGSVAGLGAVQGVLSVLEQGGHCQQWQRDTGLGSPLYPCEGHAGPAATAPGPLGHRGVCWGLLLRAPPALQYSGHGAGDGHSRWGRFWGGSRALGTALAGAGVPGPGCVRVPQPGTAQQGCRSAVGPARALRPRSGARTSSDGRCPRHRAPSPWGCSRPAW